MIGKEEGKMNRLLMCVCLMMIMILTFAHAESKYETLKPGSKGQAVLDARMRLFDLGYFKKVPTQTEYTKNMMDYVKLFEKDYGLTEDGILSPEDQEVLFGSTIEDGGNESKYKVLQPGSTGQAVLDARMRLYELGYFTKVPTQTEYTKNMMDYVRKFEKDYGLDQDGILSPEDQEVLYATSSNADVKQQENVASTENQPKVASFETFNRGLTKENFSRFWDGEFDYLDDDLMIGLSYGHSVSGIYSYAIKINSSNTASFIVTCYNPQSYTKTSVAQHYNKFINSILKTVGYQNTKTDWSPYISYGMAGSKNHVYINGYDFYFYTKTTREYPRYTSRNGVEMTTFCLDVSKVNNSKYSYETIADIYCVSGVASCGDTLTLPSEVQGKAIEGIILNKPYSIYDENIKTIVVGSQMHTVPVSTLNIVFPNLEAFVVGNNNPYLAQIDGCLYNKKAKTLVACPATKTELVIPEGIVGIEHFACQYARKLTKVEIPSTCIIVGTSAFEECTSLKEVKFSESSCWAIEEKAFNNCTSLLAVDLSATLCVEIEAHAFSGCTKLVDVHMSDVMKKIGNSAFENCPIKEIILPEELEFVGETAFDSALRSVTLHSKVNQLFPTSFAPTCLISIVKENEHYYEKDGVVFSKANELVFYPYNAKEDSSYEIPEGTTAILCNMGSQIAELTIPSSVENIVTRLPNAKLYVESGSYAESYAIEKQYSYESSLVESADLDWLYAPSSTETPVLPTEHRDESTPAASTSVPAESTPAPAESTPVPVESTPVPVESTPVPVESTPAPAAKNGNRVIYEDELVTITFEKMEYDVLGNCYIQCVVENHCNTQLQIRFENVVCNGWAVLGGSVEIPAGSKKRGNIYLFNFEESVGFSDLQLIESLRFNLTIYDDSSSKYLTIIKDNLGPYYLDISLLK